MEYVALVTLLLLCQFIFFMGLVGKARVAGDVQAPAVTGDENFERAYRVHINTLEQLMITLPAMWVCAYYFSPTVAAALGMAFLIGRALYGRAYAADPSTRVRAAHTSEGWRVIPVGRLRAPGECFCQRSCWQSQPQ